jgi:hypothetical protein
MKGQPGSQLNVILCTILLMREISAFFVCSE